MTGKLINMTDADIKKRIAELEAALFDEAGKLRQPQKVSYLSPVLQMYTGELTSRSSRRISYSALGIAALSLVVSLVSLLVSL